MEETINNLVDLEKYLNNNKYSLNVDDTAMLDMTIDENSIVMNVLLFGITHYIYGNLFGNIWKDPKNNLLKIRLTYYKPKMIYNNIDMSDIMYSSIMDHKNISHNRVVFEIDGDPADFDNDREYTIEFEYESLKWEVLGIVDYDSYRYHNI